MIYVTVGTSLFEFNRLLKCVDSMVEDGVLKSDNIVIQRGYSSYKPKYGKIYEFMSKEENDEMINKADFVISHGGVGSIIAGLRSKKKIIVFPRRKIYGEHIDDNQLEISYALKEKNLILVANEYDELKAKTLSVNKVSLAKFKSDNGEMIKVLRAEIENE